MAGGGGVNTPLKLPVFCRFSAFKYSVRSTPSELASWSRLAQVSVGVRCTSPSMRRAAARTAAPVAMNPAFGGVPLEAPVVTRPNVFFGDPLELSLTPHKLVDTWVALVSMMDLHINLPAGLHPVPAHRGQELSTLRWLFEPTCP